MKIEIISGSPRVESVTKRVALHLQELLTQYNIQAGLIDMREYHLPPIQTVFTSSSDAPREVRNVVERVFQANAFILVTPEYNGGYSPTLKNFLDHFPKQDRKVFGIVTASPGALGGMRAAMQLQNLVYGFFGIGSPRMLVTPEVDKKFDEKGNLLDPSFKNAIKTFLEEFLWIGNAIHRAQVLNSNKVSV